jgi:small subunit ribosomal protein S20
MAHHKSALKRIRQSEKRKLYNRRNKKLIRETMRSVHESKTMEEGTERLSKLMRVLDKASSRGILHKNNAANHKSALSKLVAGLKTA